MVTCYYVRQALLSTFISVQLITYHEYFGRVELNLSLWVDLVLNRRLPETDR